eukprot:PhM_4_TR1229/c0_g1_i1/m.24369
MVSPRLPSSSSNSVVTQVRAEAHKLRTAHTERLRSIQKRKEELEAKEIPIVSESDINHEGYTVNQRAFGLSSNVTFIETLVDETEESIRHTLKENLVDEAHQRSRNSKSTGTSKHDGDDDDDDEYKDDADVENVYKDLDDVIEYDDDRPTSLVATLHCEQYYANLPENLAAVVDEMENSFTLLYVDLLDSGIAQEDGEEFVRRCSWLKNSALLRVVELFVDHIPGEETLLALKDELENLLGVDYTWKRYITEFDCSKLLNSKTQKTKAKSARERHLAELRTALVGDKVLQQLKARITSQRESYEHQIETLRSEHDDEVNEITRIHNLRIEKMETVEASLNNNIDQLIAERTRLLRERNEANEAKAKAETMLTETRNQAAEERRRYEEKIDALISSHDEAYAQLDGELHETRHMLEDAQAQLQSEQDRIQRLADELDGARTEVSALTQQSSTLQKSLQEAKAKLKRTEDSLRVALQDTEKLITTHNDELEAQKAEYTAIIAMRDLQIDSLNGVLSQKNDIIEDYRVEVAQLRAYEKELISLRQVHARTLDDVAAFKRNEVMLKNEIVRRRAAQKELIVNNFLLRIAEIRKPDLVGALEHKLSVSKDQTAWVERKLDDATKKLTEANAIVRRRTLQRNGVMEMLRRVELECMNFHELLTSCRYAKVIKTRSIGNQYLEKTYVGLYKDLAPPFEEEGTVCRDDDINTENTRIDIDVGLGLRGAFFEGCDTKPITTTTTFASSHPRRRRLIRPMSAPLEYENDPQMGENSFATTPSAATLDDLNIDGAPLPVGVALDRNPYDYFHKVRNGIIAQSLPPKRAPSVGVVNLSGTGTVCRRLPPTYSNPAGAWRRHNKK